MKFNILIHRSLLTAFILIVFGFKSNLIPTVGKKKSVTILYTSNNNGYLDGCDCTGIFLGGLEKRKAIIDRFRKQRKDFLLVDSGDFWGTLDRTFERQQNQYVIDIYNRLRYDAITLGDQEFLFGKDYMENTLFKTNIPIISTNLFDKDKQKPLKLPYLIKTINDIQIGIISATTIESFDMIESKTFDWISIRPYQKQIQNAIEKLNDKVDMIILLSHLGYEIDEEIGDKTVGIDLIIGGHSQIELESPVKKNNTWILHAGGNGESIGQVDIEFDDARNIKKVDGKIIQLNSSIEGDDELTKLIKKYNKILRSIESDEQNLDQKTFILGEKYCESCHFREKIHWKSSKHAVAFEALVDDRRTGDKNCLPCHTTGFGKPGGFKTVQLTRELINVQCESCHIVDLGHGSNRNFSLPKVNFVTCKSCHTKERSPRFKKKEYWKAILH